jgi:hypothetical protein
MAVETTFSRQDHQGTLHREDAVRLVRLLSVYENAEPATPEQSAAFVALHKSFPDIELPTRLEPRSPIMERLRNVFLQDEGAFEELVAEILARQMLNRKELVTFVSLLSGSRIVLTTSVVFALLEAVKQLPAGFDADDAFASLVELCGHRPSVIISLIERILESGYTRLSAVFAALQSIATYAPEHIGALLLLVTPSIEQSEINAAAFSYILTDLCRRAGAYTVLRAIAEQSPSAAPLLIRAAFGESNAPFEITQDPVEYEENQVAKVVFEGQLLPLNDERIGSPWQQWLADTRPVLRASAMKGMENTGLVVFFDQQEQARNSRQFGRPRVIIPALAKTWYPLLASINNFAKEPA